ncbi:DUF1800 domain-containing protein [Massilia sp. G4R7]|uniref:DUF1800 domain-containing protein n=1 Tax=Massilia phyllostachyos TaxID=2898585 RepID=A0ABS8PZ58_9BURK|nr:DUF1800 domain-containing protein [Massilia phyllostachyos]MCD2514791.1 DUF1800 domain-containing protein [Massilia phyllostachyos]
MPILSRRLRPSLAWAIPAVLALAAGCGRQDDAPDTQAPAFSASSGQVQPARANAVTYYAAARFADQVSFGATPALIADIQARGFEGWIDSQYALPASIIDTSPIVNYDSQIPALGHQAYQYAHRQLYASFLNAPDQLRRRVSWSLSQFIVTAINKIEPYGGLSYSNFLQRHAFGNYGELLRAVTMNPAMGIYLDNLQNRPTTDECKWCAPNENYARELLQLFTLGVVKLNLDGSIQRDAAGKPAETYSQKDVEELARALTGWRIDGDYDRTDYRRYDKELIPDPWRAAHDRGAKNVLGRAFPAGVEARQELDAIVALLMGHQNIAPFVALRLIQHHVTSDPSPAYVARVAGVFRSSSGDMKSVIKAVLLDAEARQGDQAGSGGAQAGKMREPLLWYTGLLRGMGCKRQLNWSDGNLMNSSQSPFDPASVFSFYMPTDRAPGSNILSPEQRLLNASELSWRLQNGIAEGARAAGGDCNAAEFERAFRSSPAALADLVNERYFRGAMPAVLRQNLIELAPSTWGNTPAEKAISLVQFALATPYYGVIR